MLPHDALERSKCPIADGSRLRARQSGLACTAGVARASRGRQRGGASAFVAGLAAAARDLALPAACVGCSEEGTVLCGTCAQALDVRLALPAGVPIGLPGAMPMPLAQLEWCAPFSGPVRRALHQLKYGGERRLAVPLGEAIARRWRAAGAGGELLVPVPIHAERAARRGYDQAVLLAAATAAPLDLPWIRALERTRATTPQFELGRAARRSNVREAFGIAGSTEAETVRGRWIVLIDDVVTTGSTLVACGEALLAAGARAVSAVTLARER